MSDRVPTRAELIARIALSSKDAVVMAEMKRLGFWPADGSQPTVEASLIAREAELVQTLNRLQGELQKVGDPQAALKAMRKQRMAQALERREATAQRREKERYERALKWHETRHSDVGYLGEGASAGLQADTATRPERLQRHGLPLIDTPQALAQAMGIEVPELKFLCFHREVATTTHYRRFTLPKKTGGERTISAPMPRLKRAQYWVLDNLLTQVACHPAAHGFLPGRSIVTNAAPHCGQHVVINMDLKDFFPSVAYPRIKGVFVGLGYSERVATLLALLCSENVCDELQVDGERFFVGRKARERVLPQGAPTSPMLTNILCRQLDRRLQGVADKLGFAYTRYADDLTFSASGDAAGLTGRLLRQVHHIVRDEGFTPHPDKQRVMRSGARQEVTGVVVNHKPAVSRHERRALRAALHQAQTKGLANSTWHGQPATKDVLVGYAQFVKMVDARHGAAMLAQAKALPGDHPTMPAASTFRRQAAKGETPLRRAGLWWQPAPPPAPTLQLTAGQIKAQRQARLRTERASRDAIKHPERAAERARTQGVPEAARPGDTPQPPQLPVKWGTVALQLLFVLYFSVRMKSSLVFMLGAIWLGYRMLQRKFGWPGFVLPMLVIMAIAAIVRL
jgi:RNA-directed DNA polymerase